MRKFAFTSIILGLVLMLSGCYFFVPLSAEVTIENNTDKTFYYMVTYNSVLSINTSKKTLEPGEKIRETLNGHLTEAELSNSTEYFDFYVMEESEYDAYIKEYPGHADNDWFVIVQNGSEYSAENKRSQNYKVVINPASSGYDVKVSW